MESKRQQRVSRLLQKDIGAILQTDLRHIAQGSLLTVTKVYVTPDLLTAKVFVSIFGASQKKQILDNIRHHAGEVRGKLGQRIRHQLRAVPELHFYEDDSLDYIENIENLLET